MGCSRMCRCKALTGWPCRPMGMWCETIGLNDRRRVETSSTPSCITAPTSLSSPGERKKARRHPLDHQAADTVVMACRVMPKESRPIVLYCGNSSMNKPVKEMLERETTLVCGAQHSSQHRSRRSFTGPAILAKIVAKLGRSDELAACKILPPWPARPWFPSA